MILFHAKRDGTVTTTPNFVPQGSSMQDLVVVSEFDYAYCAIRLLPASGEYIEDVPCTPIPQKDYSTIFTAALPPKATVVAGSVDYQLIFTAADGTTKTTLVGSFAVPRGVPVSTPPTVGELSEKTVSDLYEIFANIYSLFAEHEKDIVDLIESKSNTGIYVGSGEMPEDCILQIVLDEPDDPEEPDVPEVPDEPDEPDVPEGATQYNVEYKYYDTDQNVTSTSIVGKVTAGDPLNKTIYGKMGHTTERITVQMGEQTATVARGETKNNGIITCYLDADGSEGGVIIAAVTSDVVVSIVTAKIEG
jgi:hypothetical protein